MSKITFMNFSMIIVLLIVGFAVTKNVNELSSKFFKNIKELSQQSQQYCSNTKTAYSSIMHNSISLIIPPLR